MNARSVLVVLSLVACTLPSPADAQQRVRIPRTSVSIVPPAGFMVAREFAGLQGPRAAIRINEYPPDSYSDLMSAFASPKTASQRFAEEHIRFTRIEQIAVGDAQAPLAIGGQEDVNGRETLKYMTVLGGAQRRQPTVWVVFEVTDGSTIGRSDVEAALRSIEIDRLPTNEEKVAKLPFKFREVSPFKMVDAGPYSVFMSPGGRSDPSGKNPAIIIDRGPTSSTAAETAQLNETIMRKLSGFQSAKITEQGPIEFAGGRGHRLKAIGDSLAVIQIIVVSGGSYVRLAARGDPAALDEVAEPIAEIAKSVTLD